MASKGSCFCYLFYQNLPFVDYIEDELVKDQVPSE